MIRFSCRLSLFIFRFRKFRSWCCSYGDNWEDDIVLYCALRRLRCPDAVIQKITFFRTQILQNLAMFSVRIFKRWHFSKSDDSEDDIAQIQIIQKTAPIIIRSYKVILKVTMFRFRLFRDVIVQMQMIRHVRCQILQKMTLFRFRSIRK
jgi:hypothetical protein